MSYLGEWGSVASKAYEAFSYIIKMVVKGPDLCPLEENSRCFNLYGYDSSNAVIFYEMLSFKTEHEKEDVEEYIESLGTFLGLIWNGKEYVSAD